MKISIAKSILLTPLNQLAKVAGSAKGIIPILDDILLNVDANGLHMTAGNGDISLQASIPFAHFETKEAGSITVPAAKFKDIVSKVGETIEITADDASITIKSGKSKFTLSGQHAEMYPDVPAPRGTNVKVIGEDFKTAVKHTSFAAADNASTQVLMGVLFASDGEHITVVACDRHRLAKAAFGNVECSGQLALIPAKSLQKLIDIVNDKEDLTLYFDENQTFAVTKDFTVHMRLLDGVYPDTSKLIPTSHKTLITVPTDDLAAALDRVDIVAKEEKTQIAKFTASEGEIKLETKSATSYAEESLSGEIEGETAQFSFNVKFAIQAIKTIKTEKVKIIFNGPTSPFLFKGEGNDTDTQLILPYRSN